MQLDLLLHSHLRIQDLLHWHFFIHHTGGLHFSVSLFVPLTLLLNSCDTHTHNKINTKSSTEVFKLKLSTGNFLIMTWWKTLVLMDLGCNAF